MFPLLAPAFLSVVFQLQAPGLLPIQRRPGHSPDRLSWPCPRTSDCFTCLGGSESRPASRLCPPGKPLHAPSRRASPGGFGSVPAAYCPAPRSSRSFSSCKRRASSRYSAARAVPQTGPPGPVRGPRMISPAWAEVNPARHQGFALRANPCTRLSGAPRLWLWKSPGGLLSGPALLPVVLQLQTPGLLPVQRRPGHSPDRSSRSCPGAPHDLTRLGGSEFRPAAKLCPPGKPLHAPFRRASPTASEESRRPIVRPCAPPGRSPAVSAGPPPGTVPPGPLPPHPAD